jgi:hypothetical protein
VTVSAFRSQESACRGVSVLFIEAVNVLEEACRGQESMVEAIRLYPAQISHSSHKCA